MNARIEGKIAEAKSRPRTNRGRFGQNWRKIGRDREPTELELELLFERRSVADYYRLHVSCRSPIADFAAVWDTPLSESILESQRRKVVRGKGE